MCLTALQVTRVYCCGAMSTGIDVHVGIGLICLTVLQVTRVYYLLTLGRHYASRGLSPHGAYISNYHIMVRTPDPIRHSSGLCRLWNISPAVSHPTSHCVCARLRPAARSRRRRAALFCRRPPSAEASRIIRAGDAAGSQPQRRRAARAQRVRADHLSAARRRRAHMAWLPAAWAP